MTKRVLPRIGGGEPIIMAGGRATTVRRSEAPAPITLMVSVDPAAEAAGRELIERICDACDRNNFDLLASIGLLFPSIAERTPEFHALMDELVANEQHDDIATILRTPGKRGPKRDNEFDLVAMIEHVKRTEKLTETTAAIRRLIAILAEERDEPVVPGSAPVPTHPSERTLRTRHSALRQLFRIWSNSVYVPAELLTQRRWLRRGTRSGPPNLVMTKLSNAIVFHSPDDSITEPGEEN